MTIIMIRGSTVPGRKPETGELAKRELYINEADGLLFSRRPDGTIRQTPLDFDPDHDPKDHDHDIRYAAKDHSHSDLGGGLPVGSFLLWSTTTPPSGYLFCDGSEFDQTLYPSLFGVIGHDYDTTPNAGKFRVPDRRKNFIRGWDAGDDITVREGESQKSLIVRVAQTGYTSASGSYQQPLDGSEVALPSHAYYASSVSHKTNYLSASTDPIHPQHAKALICIKY